MSTHPLDEARRSNSYILDAYFDDRNKIVENICSLVAAFPVGLRPTHVGAGERTPRRDDNRIASETMLYEYASRNDTFFLLGRKMRVLVIMFDSKPSHVTAWVTCGEDVVLAGAQHVCEVLLGCGASYGFMCHCAERILRNMCVFAFADVGQSEAICGRDHRRYVPGLYWMNFFSDAYLRHIGVDLNRLSGLLRTMPVRVARGYLLRLYESPSCWEKEQPRIEAVATMFPQIFSLSRVQIPVGMTFRESASTPQRLPSSIWP